MKKFRLYQMAGDKRWYLKAIMEQDHQIGWLNTYDETEALVLDEPDVIVLALEGLKHGLDIYVEEVR